MKLSTTIEVIILTIAVLTFLREALIAPEELKNILYFIFLIILLLIAIAFVYYAVKDKLKDINRNKERIEKLEQELDFIKRTEQIKIDLEILKREVLNKK